MSNRVVVHPTGCCGLRTLRGLKEDTQTRKALISVCRSMYKRDLDCAFMTFSNSGKRLASYIKRYKLGDIKSIQSEGRTVFVWEINNTSTRAWFSKNGK